MSPAEITRIEQVRARLDREAEAAQSPPIEAYADEDLQGFADTDIANAQRLAKRHGADIRYTTSGGWLVWDGKRWVIDERDVRVQARAVSTALSIFDEIKISPDRDGMMKHAKRSQTKRAIDAMIWLARSEGGILAALTDFDSSPWLLNLSNGTLNLQSGELQAHRREDLITRFVPIEYHPAAKCALWDSFLHRICAGDTELIAYIKRMVGYLLTGSTAEQALHFLYGLGANGKSVFCEVVSALLGDYSVVVSPNLIMLKQHAGIPNDVARLRGARVALMNETTQGAKFDEAKLKDLTGGDTLTARFLHREFFDFHPTHKLIIRGNHKPAISGTDEGIWRRLRLIPFVVQIPPEEQDHHLLEKLRGELPGILRWAVEGCLEWQRNGLNPPAIVTDAVRQYREESDTLGRFISECCEVRRLAEVKSSVFFQRYRDFVEKAGERGIPSKEMPTEMLRRSFEQKRDKHGKRYLGIELAGSDEPHWSDRE